MRRAQVQVPADRKNAARDFTASPRSLPSFLFFNRSDHRSSPSSEQFRRCSRRCYINNDPARSNNWIERKERKKERGGRKKKESNPLISLSFRLSLLLHAHERTDTYFTLLVSKVHLTSDTSRTSSTSSMKSNFNFYFRRFYARGGNIAVYVISKIPPGDDFRCPVSPVR